MAASTNILLNLPGHGTFVDSWDVPVNGDFSSLDGFCGGVQAINAAGASPITLTSPAGTPTPSGGPTQAENAVLRFSGTLTGNVQVTLPLPGYMIIENLTTGAFVLSFRAIASGEVIGIEQGSTQHIYNDGTNVRFVNLQPIGTYLDVCDASVPAWITACTKPPFLNCDGSTFSAGTYPYLNSKLGGNTLPDLRGASRYALNQGTSRLTTAGSGLDGNTRFALKTTQTYTLLTANLPPYTPAGTGVFASSNAPATGSINTFSQGGGSQFQAFNNGTASLIQVVGGITFTGTAQGGTSTPFGTVGPGTISGLMLIRAA